jgi:energy-coupling factor transport system ATP-binding protein
MRPRCIIFDEATTMLDPEGRRMALDWMLRLNTEGITILYVTHHMEEAAMARRVVVFQNGQVALDGTPRQVFGDPSRLSSLGLEPPPAAALAERLRPYLPGLPPGILTPQELHDALVGENSQSGSSLSPASPVEAGAPLIEVSHLSHTYLSGTPLEHPSLINVTMAVAAGASHGLLGRTGSGKSTLLQHLNGLLRPQGGTVRVGEFNLADPAVLTRSVIRQVGLVFQNPEMQFFEQFVGDEIAYGPRQFPSAESLAARVRLAMELVGLDFEAFKDRLLYTLSGGERRKVALASVLALHPSILLLDEPTAGLDPHSHAEILQRLKELQAGGMTLVLSSHRMEDLAELAQNLSLFDAGRVPISGPLPQVFGARAALEAAGLEQPLAVQAAGWLRARGWPLSPDVVTPAQLSAAMATAPRPAEGPAQLGPPPDGETLTSGEAAP